MEKFCPNCQKDFDSTMDFCLQCGKPLQAFNTSADKITNCVFKFKCPLEWGKLDKTDIQGIRFCDICNRNVHFARTQSELDDLAGRGKCVAFHRTDNPLPEKTFEPPTLMGVIVPAEGYAEMIERLEKEKRQAANSSNQTETKSWWKFWK